MEKEKKSFKEKWQDKKYQAKIQLSGYGILIFVVVLLIILGQNNNKIENNPDILNNNVDVTENNSISFSKPNVNYYTYKIEIITEKDDFIEKNYYYGKVKDTYEELIKEIGEVEYNYKIIDNKYYILDNDNYILTTKEEVYDILDYKYLNIDNINNYLSYSEFVDGKYQVYLKDIVLDSNTEEYITILFEGDNISIDYTNLINILNNENYNSYIVNIEYEE